MPVDLKGLNQGGVTLMKYAAILFFIRNCKNRKKQPNVKGYCLGKF